ncbi:MAG: ATP-grasp domain-containing protein [Betaproteobacteria bacterium]|nr:ATP-grasp domain-containing protein [Betaproteobacteria bacterium]
MRVLVYEYFTATASAETPRALIDEGDAMVRALMADLAAVRGLTVVNPYCPMRTEPQTGRSHAVYPEFAEFLQDVDAVWPIAPESDGVLESLTRLAERAGRQVLNSSADAVALTASKSGTAAVLRASNVLCLPTFHDAESAFALASLIVMKPDDGAGCVDTRLIETTQRGRISSHPRFIYQPFVEGEPRSLSMLCDDDEVELLSINRQHIRAVDGRLHADGVQIGVYQDTDAVISNLARRIKRAIPGLFGFVGVDFIQTPEGPMVVEINPRLTSAYPGLSARLGRNIAAEVLSRCASELA